MPVNVSGEPPSAQFTFWMSILVIVLCLVSVVCIRLCYIWFSETEGACESIQSDCGNIVTGCHEGIKRGRRKCRPTSHAETFDRTT